MFQGTQRKYVLTPMSLLQYNISHLQYLACVYRIWIGQVMSFWLAFKTLII